MELKKNEKECGAKVHRYLCRKFNRLLRIYEPSSLTPSTLQEMREECHDKLYMALGEMVDSMERFSIKHEHELGSHVVAVWKQMITDGQGEFINFLDMVSSKLEPPQDSAQMPVNVSMPSGAITATPDQSNAVNDAMADVKVTAEIVAAEVSPDAVAEVTEIASMQVKVYTEGDHAEAAMDKTSDDEVNLDDAIKAETSGDEVSHNDATKDELAMATTNHAPAAVESMGGVREEQDGCRGRDWMLLMSILRKFRTGSKPQMSFMNLWGRASRMTLCLAPTPLLLLQLMVLLLMLVDVHDALFSCVSRAPKVTVMYEEEHEISYTHESILTGEPEYHVPMIGVRQEVSYDVSYGVPYYEVPCNMIGVSQDVSYDVSYSVPYYEVPCDMPCDMVLTALRISSDLKVEEDNLLPGFSIDYLVAALAGPRLLSR